MSNKDKNNTSVCQRHGNRSQGDPFSIITNYAAARRSKGSEQITTELIHALNLRNTLYEARRIVKGITNSRVKSCGYSLLPHQEIVSACSRTAQSYSTAQKKLISKKNLFWQGLQKCGSVWECPVCSLKISSERQKQIYNIVSNMKKQDVEMYHATFTIQHDLHEGLKENLDVLLTCWRKMTKNRIWQEYKQAYHVEGYIRSLEVTWSGKNGWHPHLHVLFAFKPITEKEKELLKVFNNWLREEWEKIVNEYSYKKLDSKYSVTFTPVKSEKDIAEYIGKWDLSKEMTQGMKKIGKVNSNIKVGYKRFTPFMLITEIDRKQQRIKGLETLGGKEETIKKMSGEIAQYRELFREYATAFKGKKQLQYSENLKKKYLNAEQLKKLEQSDFDIVKSEKVEEIIFGVHKSVWELLRKKKLEAELLNQYTLGGVARVKKILKVSGINVRLSKGVIVLRDHTTVNKYHSVTWVRQTDYAGNTIFINKDTGEIKQPKTKKNYERV